MGDGHKNLRTTKKSTPEMTLLFTRRFLRVRPVVSSLRQLCLSHSNCHNAKHISIVSNLVQASRFRWPNEACLVTRNAWLSTVASNTDDTSHQEPVRILFGSQGGTAQLFSMQLADAVSEADAEREVSVMGLQESASPSQILDPEALNVFFVSTAGVGEPPDNAREFYNWLMAASEDELDWSSLRYAVFGLGNKQAHPNHYNVIGKSIASRLEQLGAVRVHETGLGDDGDCIEDDCDIWVQSLIESLTSDDEALNAGESETLSKADSKSSFSVQSHYVSSPVGNAQNDFQGMERDFSNKYRSLVLLPPQSEVIRDDLFHLQNTANSFYEENTRKLRVLSNGPLNSRCGDYGLREISLSLDDQPDISYDAGDLVLIYPRNSNCIVDAYLNVLGVDPQSIIEQKDNASRLYPHPTGLTVRETLSHCVDLGALPSPSFSRELLQRKDINYKEDIASARRTVLDLIYECGNLPTLEELFFHLPPMRPRYYSIASSPLVHPQEVYLTYRPVKYVTNRGVLREGVATTYMSNLVGAKDDDGTFSYVSAAVKSNPNFRLPQDIATPILLVAGGCGVAPIRAFLEERMARKGSKYGEGHLFLGFRNPQDEVYRNVIDRAEECGALSTTNIAYSSGCFKPDQKCGLISEVVQENGDMVYEAIQSGAYIYICGGQRSLGVAVENVLHSIIQEKGNMSPDAATDFLRQLGKEGRLCEDLAD